MILKKLLIENIRTYEAQEILFPKGSTLLSGDIGSGKTTILLALEFALFGIQPSQKAASLLRTGKNEARVVLECEIDGKNVIIERNLKKKKKTISQGYTSITINDEKFDGSVTEIKNKVLNLLNYPQEFAKKTNLLYKFTVYTPQEEMKQIILESGDTRLNTLRYVFGIDKYKRIQENTLILGSRLREKIRINEALIQFLEQNKEILKQKKENLSTLKQKFFQTEQELERETEKRKQEEQLLNEIQEKINEKSFFETEKAKSEVLILEKVQQITALSNSLKFLNQDIQEAKKISFDEQDLLSLRKRIEFQKNKEQELQKEYIQVISKINSLESKKLEAESLKNKISRLEKCPTCLQEVSEEYKINISTNADNEIAQVSMSISELINRKNQLIKKIEEIKETIESFIKQVSDLEFLKIKIENIKEKQKRIYEVESQKQSLNKDVEILQKHLSIIQQSIKDYEKYELSFKQKNKELEEAKNRENNALIKKIEIKKEIQFLEQEISEKQSEIEKKENLKKEIEKIKELEFWVSNKFLDIILFTEKRVMATLKEEFSKLFSRWFSILISDSLSASLSDDFSPIIEQQDYELDYSFLSGGERTAIALAYRLALNQVINFMLSNIRTSDLVILDEPTDGFSSQQLDKMRDVLSQLNIEQLILVSHESKIEDFVDNIIRIKKENGLSEIDKRD